MQTHSFWQRRNSFGPDAFDGVIIAYRFALLRSGFARILPQWGKSAAPGHLQSRLITRKVTNTARPDSQPRVSVLGGHVMERIFINGRFLTQRQTGVQRYALETLIALDALLSEAPVQPQERPELVVLAPLGTPAPNLRAIGFKALGPFAGNAWEQVTLPLVCGRSMLIGFTSTGPLIKSNQVVTMHDAAVFSVPETYGRAFRTWYRFALPLLAKRSHQLVTVSEFSKSELVRNLGRAASNAVVADEGWEHVLREAPKTEILTRHGLERGTYVLAVGSITPHKNLAVVAHASRLLPKSPRIEFAVAGPIDASIFNSPELCGGDALKLLGYVDAGELRALYENAAVFVHPSKYEGFGIPPLEAMALGCPVIASDAAAIPEICGDGAWYFSPDDAAKLAAQIATLIREPEVRASLIEHGRAQVQRHSWRGAAKCYLNIIRQLVEAQCTKHTGSTQVISTTSTPV
jgi:glycosyltransferase involved in cell wall biosynthesis